MSRAPSTFRQRDLKCALAAARQAGIDVAAVTVDKTGTIKIIAGKPESPGKDPDRNEWDTVLGEN
jgi:hypothetical protein